MICPKCSKESLAITNHGTVRPCNINGFHCDNCCYKNRNHIHIDPNKFSADLLLESA